MEEPPEEPTTVHVTVVEPAAKAPTGEEAALNEVAVQELIEEQPPVEQPLEQPTIVEATNEEPTTEEPTIEVTPALSPLPALEQDMGGSPATEVLQTPSQPASSGTCHSCPACGTIPLSGTAAARTLSSLHFLPNGQGYSITTLPSGAILLVPVAQQEVATSAATGADIAEPVSASASVVDSRGTDTEMIPPFYVHAPLPAPASPAAGSAIGSAIGSLENMVSALGLFLGNSLSVAQAQPATEAAAEPTAVVNGNASEGGDGEDEADAGDTADAGDAEATKKQKKNRKRNQTRKKAEKVAQAQAQAAAQAQAQSQAQQALVQANVQTQGPIQIPPGGIYLTCGGVPMGIDPHDPRLRELYESYVKLEASTAEMKVWTDEMRRNRELREATALLRLPAPTPSEIWSA
jgi:hypothetical protein